MNPLFVWRSWLRTVVVGVLVCLGILRMDAQAAAVSGISLPDTARVADQPLVLNGAGLRTLAVFKVYVVGLYLPQRAAYAPSVLDMPGPKRLQLVLMRDVGGNDLGRALARGIEDNHTSLELPALQLRVQQLAQAMSAMGTVHKGSEVLMDYLPGVGTHIVVNGAPLLADIAGEDFYKALLMSWLGPQPAGEYLKQSLLGTPR